jgi:hypothetical protein
MQVVGIDSASAMISKFIEIYRQRLRKRSENYYLQRKGKDTFFELAGVM